MLENIFETKVLGSNTIFLDIPEESILLIIIICQKKQLKKLLVIILK